jgi:hypothetical protein
MAAHVARQIACAFPGRVIMARHQADTEIRGQVRRCLYPVQSPGTGLLRLRVGYLISMRAMGCSGHSLFPSILRRPRRLVTTR